MRIFAFLAALAGLAALTGQILVIGLQTVWAGHQNLLQPAAMVSIVGELVFILFVVVFLLMFAGSKRGV